MSANNIQELLAVKETPALSITLPTDKTDKARNREALKNAVRKANVLIDKAEFSSETKKRLNANLQELTQHMPHATSDGLGIYVSPDLSQVVLFPFAVKPETLLANSFAARDLIYMKDFSEPYLVLLLSRKSVRLFRAEMNSIQEVNDQNFPVAMLDDYEYARPSIGSSAEHSLKSFEKDKGALTNLRITSMLRQADLRLTSVLKKRIPVVLAGTERIVANYKSLTANTAEIIGEVHGSFKEKTLNSLALKSWESFKRHKESERTDLLHELRDANNGYLAKGVQESWEAVEEGKGYVLAVEKDYHCHGYLVGSHVQLNAPKKPYKDLKDAIDELIIRAIRKNVKVVLMENNALREYNHIALQCRY